MKLLRIIKDEWKYTYGKVYFISMATLIIGYSAVMVYFHQWVYLCTVPPIWLAYIATMLSMFEDPGIESDWND